MNKENTQNHGGDPDYKEYPFNSPRSPSFGAGIDCLDGESPSRDLFADVTLQIDGVAEERTPQPWKAYSTVIGGTIYMIVSRTTHITRF